METTIIALAMLILASALATIGIAGAIERLPRNRWAGLRMQAMLEDDDAWRIGHKAAGPALIAAAGPPLLLGVALLAVPPETVEDWFLVYAVVGVMTGGLIALAARQARRAIEETDTRS